jgi:hypothetical protein
MATKIARKKFQEALKALKQACKNERLPFALRIRAAELICAIYGVPLPESSVRVKRAVKELVAEGQFDRQIREQVQEKSTQDAVASARAFLESVKGKQ